MPNKEKKLPIQFSVKRIKDFAFVVNEELFQPNKAAQIQYDQKTGYNIDIDALILTLRIYYHYPDITPIQILMEITVQNVFEISDLKRFIRTDGGLEIPKDLLIRLVSLSITHTRALLAKNTAGSMYQDTILPIANAEAVTAAFFPQAFKEDKNNTHDENNKPKAEGKKKTNITLGKNPPSKNSY